MSLRLKFDASILNAALDKMNDGIKEQVRPAAQAGAQELYDEVIVNVSGIKEDAPGVVTGTLRESIYQVFSKDNSAYGRATYHVSWNAKKAPHGHLLENGTSRMPAYPFLRPAYDAKVTQALEATREKMAEGVKKVISGAQS